MRYGSERSLEVVEGVGIRVIPRKKCTVVLRYSSPEGFRR